MDRFLFYLKKIIPRKLFLSLQPFYHFGLAFSAALFYGFPARRIKVIGITGTKGKTSVVELTHKILEETGVGVSSLSSLRFKIGNRESKNLHKMTLPGRFFVQKFLHESAQKKCRYAVLEITSEGIKQFRHRFINFEAVLMTNVEPEHIEAHGSFEKYLRAKLDLFWRMPKDALAIINKDDPNAERFSAATAAHQVKYGREEIEIGGKKLAVKDVKINKDGIHCEINGHTIISTLQGEFNFYNILAATALGLALHIPLDKIAAGVYKVSVIPGRLEFLQKNPFAVVVDYAHTPDSLRKVYETLGGQRGQRLICVLGAAGGGRDKWKRKEFGKIASTFCQKIILTNEDPYDENPNRILLEIESGISDFRFPISKILDRKEAIFEALKSARLGDTVIITGKGAEPWMAGPHNLKIPWDDREVVKERLKNLN